MYELTGKCKWAHVQHPNTTYDAKWSIDLMVDNPQMQALLESKGFNIKENKEGEKFLHIKRNVISRKGKENDAPVVLDKNGEPTTSLIGNGSTVTVGFDGFDWSSSFGSGVTAYLNTVKIVDLVPYKEAIDLNKELAEAI